jgi:hypothetical protein
LGEGTLASAVWCTIVAIVRLACFSMQRYAFVLLLLSACATGEGIDENSLHANGGGAGAANDASASGGSSGTTGGSGATAGTGASGGAGGSTASGGSGGTSTAGTSGDAGASGASTGGTSQDAGSGGSTGGASGTGGGSSGAGGGTGCDGGAVEVCNGTDDDLDGLVDEPSAQNTAACNGCTPIQRNGFAYWFCTSGRDWAPARDNCTSKGAHLASIHDQQENDFVASTMVGLGVTGRFWFGLNDRSTEGTYVWLDGTPVDFKYFNCSTTANLSTGSEDCANMQGSSKCWDDDDCSGHSFPSVCRAPHSDACP